MTGSKIAHNEITGKLGGGLMGVVYCARDSRLNRYVAIKVFPEVLADDRERLESVSLIQQTGDAEAISPYASRPQSITFVGGQRPC